MLYSFLRAAAQEALLWYYSDIVVQGAERMPAAGPVVIAANHPNALVDALLVTTTVRRRVLLTAKATLFEHAVMARLLHAVGVVPLRRVADERAASAPEGAGDGARTGRNTAAFDAVNQALIRGGAVLIFPEGISHDAPALAPLKTGAARMALAARGAGAHGLRVVPVGLIFEQKERPRSRVLVRIGEPIDVDAWHAASDERGAAQLTVDIDSALHRVTLNFASDTRAQRALAMAAALAAIAEPPGPLHRERSLGSEAELAGRIERATDALATASGDIVRRADALVERVEALAARLAAQHVALADLRVSPRLRHGAWFVLREALVTIVALPAAALGRVAHWGPLHLARAMALRSVSSDPSRDQPAMRTILLGAALVLLWYLLVAAFVAHRFGLPAALLSVALLIVCARLDFLLRGRMHRAYQRARTYLALRANPVLRLEMLAEIDAVQAEASALEQALVPGSPLNT